MLIASIQSEQRQANNHNLSRASGSPVLTLKQPGGFSICAAPIDTTSHHFNPDNPSVMSAAGFFYSLIAIGHHFRPQQRSKVGKPVTKPRLAHPAIRSASGRSFCPAIGKVGCVLE